MTTPFYVAPEQVMKDRADFARKGIARGRSVVVVQYADGIIASLIDRYLSEHGASLEELQTYAEDLFEAEPESP